MTNKELIISFLKKHNYNFCDDCLSSLTGISPRQSINQLCNKELYVFSKHANIKCHNCNKIKITRSLANTFENTKIKNCLKNERKFDFLWNEITSTLKPFQQIPNWTKHSGFLESEFEICSITNNAIEVFTIKDKHHRSIPKTDFENIFSKWDKYISGEIKRNELRDENKNTTYIISILKIFCKT